MFLHQKLNYTVTVIDDESDLTRITDAFKTHRPKLISWDTETTGLDFMKDVPFLMGFGFAKEIILFEPTKKLVEYMYSLAKSDFVKWFMAHNAKYDYHIMTNFGMTVPEDVPVADMLTLARLVSYTDSFEGNSLEALGTRLVDPNSKFAGAVIKELMRKKKHGQQAEIKNYVKKHNKEIAYKELVDGYKSRVQFVESPMDKHYAWLDENIPEITYKDIYLEHKSLMENYLADDIVLILEIMNVLESVLDLVDVGHKIFNQENKLIPAAASMERVGMRIDVQYLLDCRVKVLELFDKKYSDLHELTGGLFSVGQHQKIKDYFRDTHQIGMSSVDLEALEDIIAGEFNSTATAVAQYIIDLRGMDKLLTTYIDGKLNRIKGDRIYTEIKNWGTVTGRASSDMQQQSKEGYVVDGVEVFHPRRMFISDEGYTNYYIDFNNMEMRVQAYYTMLVSEGDPNLCSAFMPFNCTNVMTGAVYDPVKDADEWNSGLWVDAKGNPWKKTDLHTATTLQAFPQLTGKEPDFDHYRQLGKRVNFAKNYGAGKETIKANLKLDEDTANMLNVGYYRAFPKIKDYQRWVQETVSLQGYAENLFGRRYYLQETNKAYKVFNYLVQGSCADYVKLKEIEIYDILKHTGSRMVLPIHDEIVFTIKHGEEHLIPIVRAILEDAKDYFKTVPMECTVAIGNPSWADKVDLK